mmetsp:Transcript_1492/g.1964  ORF Transcript_1492/g.1964 Transcript_1492/m.1964 type:complete len:143 (+) Transcript_1492:51-479(+)
MTSADLKTIFEAFCAFGSGTVGEMDNTKFAKLVRDSGLVDGALTTTDVDLIFAHVKPKGERRIKYTTFRNQAVAEIAKRKNIPEKEIVQKIFQAGGPVALATQADHVRFHDDKSTYTGMYANVAGSTPVRRNSVSPSPRKGM